MKSPLLPVGRDRRISDFPKVSKEGPSAPPWGGVFAQGEEGVAAPSQPGRPSAAAPLCPQCYTPEACLQLREDFHAQVRAACQRRNPGSVR